jgi:predicted NUDIX family phosphoesterase
MEDKYRGERVLVFERALFESLGVFQGTSAHYQRYLERILDKKNNRFHLRYQAEKDETLKQIIPYVLFVNGDEVFSYVRGRQAGETRLVGNRSVGIGGHINPQDEMLFSGAAMATDMQTYLEAVKREIEEEVLVEGDYSPDIVAILNDDANPVGRVHFGVVHVCRLDHQAVQKREKQITQAGFVSIEALRGPRREELETWSAMALDLLASSPQTNRK